jgi:hypothetical protein
MVLKKKKKKLMIPRGYLPINKLLENKKFPPLYLRKFQKLNSLFRTDSSANWRNYYV